MVDAQFSATDNALVPGRSACEGSARDGRRAMESAQMQAPVNTQVYEAYWGLDEAPFANVPNPKFFCQVLAHHDALEKLLYITQSARGSALLTGEVGCGKSTLSRVLLTELEETRYEVGLVLNPALTSEELLYEVALQLGVSSPPTRRSELFRTLDDHLLATAQSGKTTVLIIDEAHTIRDDAVFEDLKRLLDFQLNDRNLVAMVLLGLPDLRDRIARQRALADRFALRLSLDNLSEEETAFYIDFRLKRAGAVRPIFTPAAVRGIHSETSGTPRSINSLCDLCLFEGSRRSATEVDPRLVKLALGFM